MKHPSDPKKASLTSPNTSPLAKPTRIATAARVHALDAKTKNSAKATVAVFDPKIKAPVSSLTRKPFTVQDQLSSKATKDLTL